MRRRVTSLFIAMVMMVTAPSTAYATSRESELREEAQALAEQADAISAEKSANSNALYSTEEQIGTNEAELAVLQNEIAALDEQLVQLLSDISLMQAEIEKTQEQIAEQTVALAAAEETRDRQYADMKKRIQYLYENNDNLSLLSYIASAENLTDFLNRVDSVMQLQMYDREQLVAYQETVFETQKIKNELELTEGMLVEEEVSLEADKAELDVVLEEKRARSDDYDAEIATLKEKANALSATIAAQDAELGRILSEQQAAVAEADRLAEEARKAKEEEERKAREAAEAQAQAEREAAEAAAQEAAQQPAGSAAAQAEAPQSSSTEEPATASQQAEQKSQEQPARQSTADSGSANLQDREAKARALAARYQGHYYYNAVLNANLAAARIQRPGIGEELVNYGRQFLGNPYVVAGESLTNGCDCAGYVKALYRDFGVEFNRDFTLFRMIGEQVSESEIRPGDIIMYGNAHAALYLGNGAIINSSNPREGILIRNQIHYRPDPVAVYRVFCYD